ncbi:MAG TPA: DNA repair protein RecO, partial [Solibacterales bacterium]|nr:DNA repair protein RecO [Bryobacterales bacterium]
MHACLECGSWLDDPEAPERAWFSRDRHGLYCQHCRRALDLRNTWELGTASRGLARNIVTTPIAELSPVPWTQATAADLRRFLVQQLETHIERRLITAPLLEAA